jgi:hypothetical protein
MPKEWQEKAEIEYRKSADVGRKSAERVRFVTYTPYYGKCDWVQIDALRTTFEKAMVDATRHGNTFNVTTKNVRRVNLSLEDRTSPLRVTIDGHDIDVSKLRLTQVASAQFEQAGEKWVLIEDQGKLIDRLIKQPEKRAGLQGPIDDALNSTFVVIEPTGNGFHEGIDHCVSVTLSGFAKVWDKYFRGTLPVKTATDLKSEGRGLRNIVLFGDPKSNPLIAEVLPKLPITWTKEKLIVNGTEYDPATHLPVMIYPDPMSPTRYIVLNSGHTFQEADLQGTNALLYPRLGDWAVIKPAPSAKNPLAYEVIAAGLFDENWQFVKPVR